MKKEEKRNVTTEKSLKRQALKKALKARNNILIAILTLLIMLLMLSDILFSSNSREIIIGLIASTTIFVYGICVIVDYEDVYENLKNQEKKKRLESILIQDEDNIVATVEVIPVKFKAYSTYMQNKVQKAKFYAKLYKPKEEVMIFIEEDSSENLKVYDECKLLEFEEFWEVN